jgi:hypothetical protein
VCLTSCVAGGAVDDDVSLISLYLNADLSAHLVFGGVFPPLPPPLLLLLPELLDPSLLPVLPVSPPPLCPPPPPPSPPPPLRFRRSARWGISAPRDKDSTSRNLTKSPRGTERNGTAVQNGRRRRWKYVAIRVIFIARFFLCSFLPSFGGICNR